MRPVVDIDFRVSGLPHAVVKQAENSRVRELVKNVSQPHRQDLQADLQQSNANNPLSEKSKKMIQGMGDVELFELCETIPKVQCSECLLYWNQGIVYCTCGHLLRENQSSRGILRWKLDLLSIPNYLIKKEQPHGNRFGKTEEQIKHYIAHNLRKICIKKNFEGIHDRFQKDSTFRDSQLRIDRTEEVCIQMDKDAQKRFHLSHVARRVPLMQKELVGLSQHISTQGTDETPFRLQRSINKIAPSSPGVWRRATRTDSFLKNPEMASVVCKDNTSKDPFSQCEQLQGIHIQVKSEYGRTLTTIELVTRKQRDKHNNMFNVAANLTHVNSHDDNNWRLVGVLSLFVCSVSS